MEPFILLFLVLLIIGPILSFIEQTKRIEEGPKEKPCPPHKWEHKQITNAFGEKVWVHECQRCKMTPSV